jgi:hypothetical protein
MCLNVCFEAGRFTQIRSSWTALCCSRKWMSGHAGYAAALAQSQTDPFRQIGATGTPSTSTLREILPLGPGRGLFSLDKSLSWKSPVCGVFLAATSPAAKIDRRRYETSAWVTREASWSKVTIS